jgi:acetyl esterase/lipase
VPFERIAEEACLDGTLLAQVRRGILLRMLLLSEADRRGLVPNDGEVDPELAARFCRARGLDPAHLEGWLTANDIPPEVFSRWMREECRLAAVLSALEEEVRDRLPECLRLTGDYGPLRDRALAKEQALGAAAATGDGGVPPDAELLGWYFGQRNRRAPGDISTYAAEAGFRGSDDFLRALRREYRYALQDAREAAPAGT